MISSSYQKNQITKTWCYVAIARHSILEPKAAQGMFRGGSKTPGILEFRKENKSIAKSLLLSALWDLKKLQL